MKRRLLDFLCCPHDGATFHLRADRENGDDVEEGALLCAKNPSHAYPIIRSIPRILDGVTKDTLEANYAASFGFQWTQIRWEDPETNLREFWKTTDFDEETLRGKVFLDAGCGGGRTTAHLPKLVKEIVYVDYSIAVEKVYGKCKHHPNAHFVQASVARPPFRPESFDIVFCSGVLHHTPNTYESFQGLPPVVKPGGYLHIYVFRKSAFPVSAFHVTDHAARALISRLPRSYAVAVCKAIGKLGARRSLHWVKPFFWFSLKPDPEVRLLHDHDWYACRFHHEHSINEVMAWFAEAGFERLGYINGWPEAPTLQRYEMPRWKDSLRLGLSMTIHGVKKRPNRNVQENERTATSPDPDKRPVLEN
jgi:SAM-dependent methyltransferase